MKKLLLFFLAFSLVNLLKSQCVNGGFEQTPAGDYSGAINATAVNGWSISNQSSLSGYSGAGCPTVYPVWSSGSPKFSIVSTPITGLTGIGTLSNSPLGGTVVASIGGSVNVGYSNRLRQNIQVTAANSYFNFAVAVQLLQGGHSCCTGSQFLLRVYDCSGNLIPCLTYSVFSESCPGSSAITPTVTNYLAWCDWHLTSLDLTPYINSCVTIEVIVSDCCTAGHYGQAYFDSQCSSTPAVCNCASPSLIGFCQGANQATLQPVSGATSYTWSGPASYTTPISASQATSSPLTINYPIVGQVFTLTSLENSCPVKYSYQLVNTQISASVTATKGSCNPGTTGSATLFASGSGSGYNFFWTNAAGSPVGALSSPTIGSLAAGAYTVYVSNTAGCGSPSLAVNIPAYTSSFTISSPSLAACSGSVYNIAFSSATLAYGWNPSTFLLAATNSITTIGPVIAAGTASTITYTITGMEPLLNCTTTQTLQVSISNPMMPTVTPVPLLCSNSPPVQLTVTPSTSVFNGTGISPGGLFSPSGLLGVYTNTAYASLNGCTHGAAFTITVAPSPTLIVTGNTITCSGMPVTLSASGTSSYSWSTGATTFSTVVIPTASNNSISLSGHNVNGCSSSTLITIPLWATPTLAIAGNVTVCANEQATLTAIGVNTYTWSSGSHLQTVLAAPGLYTVSGTTTLNPGNCIATATIAISGIPFPVMAVSGNTLLCDHETLDLTASGASSYTWNTAFSGSTFSDTPATSSIYTLTGINNALCSNTLAVSVTVNECLGIKTVNDPGNGIKLYPNPVASVLTVELTLPGQLSLYDSAGRLIFESPVEQGIKRLEMEAFHSGMYLLKYTAADKMQLVKLVKE